jgi:hypothetical protein
MANADDEAVEYVLLNKKAYEAAVMAKAKTLHKLAGRWNGTIGGRSSGLLASLSMLNEYTSPLFGDTNADADL